MSAQYSDSSKPLLGIDTASPTLSVAVGSSSRGIVSRAAPAGRSSPSLLRLIRKVLDEASLELSELGGALAVRGPGSFTGLRVGLSTLLGLHRSLRLPSTAVSTFTALAWQRRQADRPIVAVVDALRDEWFTQTFRAGEPPAPAEEPVLRTADDLAALGRIELTGFQLEALAGELPEATLVEAPPLAPSLLELAAVAAPEWDPLLLTEPLYLRPPATTPPKRK